MKMYEINILVSVNELKEIVLKRLHSHCKDRQFSLFKEYIDWLFANHQIEEKEIHIDPYGFVDNLIFNYSECVYCGDKEYSKCQREYGNSSDICEIWTNGLIEYSLFKSKITQAFLKLY
ncbi:hypothetical protein [uncultured Helicobacter sp.]|uniref:hypothetical protein n=1 Tax=uncultured Helicobacter sp. TaxID=175537 RepID=UPI00262AEDE2|nr:hypothetical protein [uncultured Helicobacter sp.]